jgi:hypothetical protein
MIFPHQCPRQCAVSLACVILLSLPSCKQACQLQSKPGVQVTIRNSMRAKASYAPRNFELISVSQVVCHVCLQIAPAVGDVSSYCSIGTGVQWPLQELNTRVELSDLLYACGRDTLAQTVYKRCLGSRDAIVRLLTLHVAVQQGCFNNSVRRLQLLKSRVSGYHVQSEGLQRAHCHDAPGLCNEQERNSSIQALNIDRNMQCTKGAIWDERQGMTVPCEYLTTHHAPPTRIQRLMAWQNDSSGHQTRLSKERTWAGCMLQHSFWVPSGSILHVIIRRDVPTASSSLTQWLSQ